MQPNFIFKAKSSLKYLNKNTIFVMLLGFSSGLPLALCFGTLQMWFSKSGVGLKEVALLSLVTMPYTYKLLWAPIFDKYFPPILDKRRGWIVISQLMLSAVILCMSFLSPTTYPIMLAACGVLVAILSATQDIVFDAYKIDLLSEEERGIGVALSTEAYRVAMLVSGAGSFWLAANIGWNKTYFIMSLLMLANVFVTFFSPKPAVIYHKANNFFATLKESLTELWTRDKIIIMLVIIILYKLGDAFSHSLTSIFLDRWVDLSLQQIATINKLGASIATILGMLFGGILIIRLKLFRALLLFAALQALTNLLYVWIAISLPSYKLVAVAIFIENLCGGMGTSAFVVFCMALCSKQFSATQYAFLSSLALIGRTYLVPFAGVVVENIGWANFYLLTFIVASPVVLLILYVRKDLNVLSNKKNDAIINSDKNDNDDNIKQDLVRDARPA